MGTMRSARPLEAGYRWYTSRRQLSSTRALLLMVANDTDPSGCVGSALFQEVNRQTIRVLQHAGCGVIVPRAQGCCGAIHHHSVPARHEDALAFARANIDAFFAPSPGPDTRPDGSRVDVIVNNIAGCGAMLKGYGHLLHDGASVVVSDVDTAALDRVVSTHPSVETTDPDGTFAVGLLYGPSGCGKSSLVKAGLLPRLADALSAAEVHDTRGQPMGEARG